MSNIALSYLSDKFLFCRQEVTAQATLTPSPVVDPINTFVVIEINDSSLEILDGDNLVLGVIDSPFALAILNFKDTPSLPGEVNSFSASGFSIVEEFVQYIISELNKFPAITAFFHLSIEIINQSEANLIITQRVPDSKQFFLFFGNNYNDPINEVSYNSRITINQGRPVQTVPEWRAYCQIIANQPNAIVPQLIAELIQNPDLISDSVAFNLQTILIQIFNPQLPNLYNFKISDTVNPPIPVNIYISHVFGTAIQSQVITPTANPVYCLYAGLPKELQATFPYADYTTNIPRKFLTLKPRQEFQALANTPIFLSFIKPTAVTTAKLRIVYTLQDGTITTVSHTLTTSGDNITTANVSLKALELTAQPIISYTVYFDNQSDVLQTESISINIIQPKFQPFALLFINSLGAIDTIFLSGDAQIETKFTTDNFELKTTDAAQTKTINYQKDSVKTYTLHTPYHSLEYQKYLQQELSNSPKLWLFNHTDESTIEVQLTDDTVAEFNSADFIAASKIKLYTLNKTILLS